MLRVFVNTCVYIQKERPVVRVLAHDRVPLVSGGVKPLLGGWGVVKSFAYLGLSLCSLPSAKKSKGQQESWWRWLKAALLLSSAAVGGLLSWSYLSTEDGVTEVLAHHRDSLQDKFIEVPCSEDYDSHKRFEGIWVGLPEVG